MGDKLRAEVDAYVAAGERRQRRWAIAGTIAAIVLGGGIWLVATCVQTNHVPVGEKRAIEALEAAGMRNVILGGAEGFACAEAESSRHFSATNSSGARVEGTVCCGISGVGKGCTIRWGR